MKIGPTSVTCMSIQCSIKMVGAWPIFCLYSLVMTTNDITKLWLQIKCRIINLSTCTVIFIRLQMFLIVFIFLVSKLIIFLLIMFHNLKKKGGWLIRLWQNNGFCESNTLVSKKRKFKGKGRKFKGKGKKGGGVKGEHYGEGEMAEEWEGKRGGLRGGEEG